MIEGLPVADLIKVPSRLKLIIFDKGDQNHSIRITIWEAERQVKGWTAESTSEDLERCVNDQVEMGRKMSYNTHVGHCSLISSSFSASATAWGLVWATRKHLK